MRRLSLARLPQHQSIIRMQTYPRPHCREPVWLWVEYFQSFQGTAGGRQSLGWMNTRWPLDQRRQRAMFDESAFFRNCDLPLQLSTLHRMYPPHFR